jgi:hypothetical protein
MPERSKWWPRLKGYPSPPGWGWWPYLVRNITVKNPQKRQDSPRDLEEEEEGQGFFESTSYLCYKFCNSSLSGILITAAQHNWKFVADATIKFKPIFQVSWPNWHVINIYTRWRWKVTFTLSTDIGPGRLSPYYPLHRRCERPEGLFECGGKQKIWCLIWGFAPFSQVVFRNTAHGSNARDALAQMDVFPRRCTAIYSALLSRSQFC